MPVGQQTCSQVAYAGDYDYYLGVGYTDLWTGGNGGWHYFRGRLDEASLYQRAPHAQRSRGAFCGGWRIAS